MAGNPHTSREIPAEQIRPGDLVEDIPTPMRVLRVLPQSGGHVNLLISKSPGSTDVLSIKAGSIVEISREY